MSKLLLPILCLCLTAWLFGGAAWFSSNYADNTQKQIAWKIQDANQTFSSSTTFSFQQSDAELILDENQHAMIAEIAQYLTKNKDRNLQLNGKYTKREINNSDFSNLGLARAESFRYLLYRQGVELDQLEVSSELLSKHELNSNGLINNGVGFHFAESPLAKYSPYLSMVKAIYFEPDSSTKLSTEDFNNYLATLQQYLVDYPEKKIQLTGFSSSVNHNSLTRKRVYNLEKKLLENGINQDQLSIKLEATDSQSDLESFVEARIL